MICKDYNHNFRIITAVILIPFIIIIDPQVSTPIRLPRSQQPRCQPTSQRLCRVTDKTINPNTTTTTTTNFTSRHRPHKSGGSGGIVATVTSSPLAPSGSHSSTSLQLKSAHLIQPSTRCQLQLQLQQQQVARALNRPITAPTTGSSKPPISMQSLLRSSALPIKTLLQSPQPLTSRSQLCLNGQPSHSIQQQQQHQQQQLQLQLIQKRQQQQQQLQQQIQVQVKPQMHHHQIDQQQHKQQQLLLQRAHQQQQQQQQQQQRLQQQLNRGQLNSLPRQSLAKNLYSTQIQVIT